MLSLADAFVITGFFIQKWIAFGFRWCLSKLRRSLRHTLSVEQGHLLAKSIRIAQQLVFSVFAFNELTMSSNPKRALDLDVTQLNQFIERYACRVPNFYR